DAEKAEFQRKLAVCQEPVWVTESLDLSATRGKDVELDIRYVTDAGYTEFGIVLDNFRIGADTIDFEEAGNRPLHEFTLLTGGEVEKFYNQFYLFEYRVPSVDFTEGSEVLSYNMDRNLRPGTQSMFMPSA